MTASPAGALVSAIRSHAEDLGVWLAIWAGRSEPDAHARRCANDAIDAIDAMQRDLYAVRAGLVDEIRDADDATAVRADALLNRSREGGKGVVGSQPGLAEDADPL